MPSHLKKNTHLPVTWNLDGPRYCIFINSRLIYANKNMTRFSSRLKLSRLTVLFYSFFLLGNSIAIFFERCCSDLCTGLFHDSIINNNNMKHVVYKDYTQIVKATCLY